MSLEIEEDCVLLCVEKCKLEFRTYFNRFVKISLKDKAKFVLLDTKQNKLIFTDIYQHKFIEKNESDKLEYLKSLGINDIEVNKQNRSAVKVFNYDKTYFY